MCGVAAGRLLALLFGGDIVALHLGLVAVVPKDVPVGMGRCGDALGMRRVELLGIGSTDAFGRLGRACVCVVGWACGHAGSCGRAVWTDRLTLLQGVRRKDTPWRTRGCEAEGAVEQEPPTCTRCTSRRCRSPQTSAAICRRSPCPWRGGRRDLSSWSSHRRLDTAAEEEGGTWGASQVFSPELDSEGPACAGASA